MAVVSGHPGLPRAALSPLRALFIVTFLFAISGGLAYLFVMPLRQVYWGVYSRMRPMISEQDVHASGRLTEPVEPELRGSTLGKRQPAIDAVHVATRPNTLTKELVRTVAINNTVMVTWANFHYLDFVMNWVQHVQATGCTAYLVGAMDDTLLELLLSKSVPTFGMSSGLTLGDFGWGTPTFHKMGREKIALIAHVTGLGFDVLISDVDTVWLRNPLPYLAMYPAADILTSSDHLRNTVADEGLERWPDAGSAANIGIMLFRSTARNLASEWVVKLQQDDNLWDQQAFNDLYRRGSKPLPDRDDRLFECYDATLKCGILPVSIFCSGHTGFTQRMPDQLGLLPYVVHATFQFSGTPGKRHRMRERLWWNDAADYFSSSNGFLTYDDTVPQALLQAVANVQRNFTLEATMPHFNLINYQLRQMRAAFRLAQLTGRAVILPRLVCGMDRWWAPHDGTIPGSALALPYLCPADHVLDLEAMSAVLAEDDFGPNLQFREYSFLQNPLATVLNTSVSNVVVCQHGHDACLAGANNTRRLVQPGLNDQQVKAILMQGELAKAKVLRVVGIEWLFGAWADVASEERFKRRLDRYGSIWCCVDAHPGHIWYDFFFDQAPHQDRHGRMFEKGWRPLTGP
ncbi:hypothetical protein D9Q98_002576 [Chlorella vulgaris]|uniref:Nucleotide-diphospho-sugar transferase domain-containing protein n=1 Tax=Chlorella vulgaris TaxID=3077 RepID=A0A9D4TTM1_CHLVU|nr:hypothetical protein D9Q98_002576 [Chlorella vulgaris]